MLYKTHDKNGMIWFFIGKIYNADYYMIMYCC